MTRRRAKEDSVPRTEYFITRQRVAKNPQIILRYFKWLYDPPHLERCWLFVLKLGHLSSSPDFLVPETLFKWTLFLWMGRLSLQLFVPER